MKLSKKYVKTAFKIKERETGRRFDCFIQNYEDIDGVSVTRFNIGVNGWEEWNFICFANEEDFNEHYEIV